MFVANPIINDIERTNNHHKTLQKLINQTARNVLKKTRLDKIPIEELLKRANFKSVNQIVIKQMLKETWRMANHDDHPLIKLLEHPNAKTRMKSKGCYRKIRTTEVMRVPL